MAKPSPPAPPTSTSRASSGTWRPGSPLHITHRGRPVARLVPEPAPDAKRLTPEQEQALAESVAWARSLKPPAEPPTDLPADWPRNRDELYDEMLRERSGGR